MTCIVGYVDKVLNRVIIGGDSAGTSDCDLRIHKDPKVFRNGDFIFGCTSSFRMIQLLRFSFKPPQINPDIDIYEYMCNDFINSVRETLKNGGLNMKDSYGQEIGGTFLVGFKNRLFYIDSDYQVSESITGIDAVGCGASYALGALHVLTNDVSNINKTTYINSKSNLIMITTTDELVNNELSSSDKVLYALRIAAKLAIGVAEPFILMNT